MTDLFQDWIERPFRAASGALDALARGGATGRSLETAAGRLAHGLTAPRAGAPSQPVTQSVNAAPTPAELERDTRVLDNVPLYLARGIDLKRWWDQVDALGGPEDRFPLERSFNRPTRSYGFYGDAPVGGELMPVMGNVQEMFYDQIKAAPAGAGEGADWIWQQARQFVMKYFMRVSSFRVPETYSDASQPVPPPALARLSWCPDSVVGRVGFGFSQLFHKDFGKNVVEPFPSFDRHAIVDQRDVGRLYEWLLLKVRIFDFAFGLRPFGSAGPELTFELNEESYLVVHDDFVNFREGEALAAVNAELAGQGKPKVLGEYGIGYAFVKTPVAGLFAYGPGAFDAAIELINFRIYETGYISVRMIFISNRPTKVMNFVIDPVDWSFRLADVFSFGLASRALAPVRDVFRSLPLRVTVDPVNAYVDAANLISNGDAARTLCISRETLEKLFLVQHFRQHYQTVLGSLETWRFVGNWLDEKQLPPWIISGISS
jgi:hypothetical protein